jgi:hypothetical protein
MLRKLLISLTAAAVLATGMTAATTSAEAKHWRRHHHIGIGLGFYPMLGFGFGYPDYPYYYYDDYPDCRYRRVAIKKWNKAHTHRIVVYRKRWTCY